MIFVLHCRTRGDSLVTAHRLVSESRGKRRIIHAPEAVLPRGDAMTTRDGISPEATNLRVSYRVICASAPLAPSPAHGPVCPVITQTLPAGTRSPMFQSFKGYFSSDLAI